MKLKINFLLITEKHDVINNGIHGNVGQLVSNDTIAKMQRGHKAKQGKEKIS